MYEAIDYRVCAPYFVRSMLGGVERLPNSSSSCLVVCGLMRDEAVAIHNCRPLSSLDHPLRDSTSWLMVVPVVALAIEALTSSKLL